MVSHGMFVQDVENALSVMAFLLRRGRSGPDEKVFGHNICADMAIYESAMGYIWPLSLSGGENMACFWCLDGHSLS